MSLFKRTHVVKVPAEFLDEGESDPSPSAFLSSTQRRWRRRTSPTPSTPSNGRTRSWVKLSEEQRQASLDRQRTVDSDSIKRAQERAEEPDTFDDFDQHTLVSLAHVQHQVESRIGSNSPVNRLTTSFVWNGSRVKSTT